MNKITTIDIGVGLTLQTTHPRFTKLGINKVTVSEHNLKYMTVCGKQGTSFEVMRVNLIPSETSYFTNEIITPVETEASSSIKTEDKK